MPSAKWVFFTNTIPSGACEITLGLLDDGVCLAVKDPQNGYLLRLILEGWDGHLGCLETIRIPVQTPSLEMRSPMRCLLKDGLRSDLSFDIPQLLVTSELLSRIWTMTR